MSKIERRYAMWKVSIETDAGGNKSYSFTNVATGRVLGVSRDAANLGRAYVEKGVQDFGFELAGGGADRWTAAELSNKASETTLTLMNVQTLSENTKTGGTANLSDFEGKGSYKVELVDVVGANDRYKNAVGMTTPELSFGGTGGDAATVGE